MAFDPSVTVWTCVVFAVVVMIMAKAVWNPLLNAMEKRESQVASGLEEAERAREEAQRLTAEFDARMKEARAEAQRVADDARSQAEKIAVQVEADARANADRLIERARQEIETARRQALDEVRQLSVDVSIQAAGAVLKRSVDADDNRKLAAKVIKMVKKEGTGS